METVKPLEIYSVPLSECLGQTLAQDVIAKTDSPPFDKSLMDGFAVRSSDVSAGKAELKIIEIITAGQVPRQVVGEGEAAQIMTGAPIPSGADLVVKIEETTVVESRVRVISNSVKSGMNILRRGTSVRSGAVVLRAGTKLNGSRIGALAELGLARIDVYRRPRVAILATGDELVPVEELPGPGQIRNSNESMLIAQIQSSGAIPVPLGIARDNREELRQKIEMGLQCDMLVLSGGVSAGILDLVPSELHAAGVREVFHQVALKPGKPMWFGAGQNTCVFGLPGNPVSSLVCCELFVRSGIKRMMGEDSFLPEAIPARLEHDYSARADRPTYHPASLIWSGGVPVVRLVPWHGSSDLCGTVAANSMAFLSGEAHDYRSGDTLQVFKWE